MSDCCYCLGTGSESKNLKVLPCSHTYCLSCLEINYRTVGVLRCGQCLKVFTNALDSLPSKGEAEEIKMAESNCETCNPSSPAIVFCKQCKKRFCSQHPDRVIELGCRECHGVYCVECSNDKGGCFNADRGAKKDNQHDLRSLNLLVNSLAKAKNCVKGDASNKGHRLALLTKHTDRRVGEFDGETEKMMEELRSCRAQQIEALNKRYDQLEQTVKERRAQSRSKLTEFKDDQLVQKQTRIDFLVQEQDERFKTDHQVDIVTNYNKTSDQLRILIEEPLPSITIRDQICLKNEKEYRDIELKVTAVADIRIDEDTEAAARKNQVDDRLFADEQSHPAAPPRALRFISKKKVSGPCYAVCRDGDVTYVALATCSVDVLVTSSPRKLFLHLQNPVDSIVVHDHLLYCLVKAEASHDVYNYDIDGRLLNKWTHYDSNGSTNGMAVLSDQIVIPDRAEQKLAIYSLDGSHVRPISCPSLGNDHTSICGAGKNSVIVTSTGNNKVFKVNICTGEQEWVCEEIGEPAGVTCYTDYVLVASSNYMADVTIWVLDAYDGKLVTVLTDRTKRDRSAILNLYMDGNNLIVPRFDSHQVFFYELKF